ncbi:MAG: radical SAM protein [bacterium]|nr:radical SAM protein [bacterium]
MTNKEEFHNTHEIFTDKAYNTPGMLPHRYVLVLTNKCNLRCDFCFQDKRSRESDMTADDWIQFSNQLPDYARITLTGGEPLIYPGFKKVFSHIAERFNCNIITNGTLLNEDVIDFILSFPNFKVLSISIDNIGNTLRGISKNKWAHTENMIRYFIRRRRELNSPECVLDAKTMVLDENAGELSGIHQYCVEELGFDHHAFQFLKGSPIQHADRMFEFENALEKSDAYVYKNFEVIKQELDRVRKYNLETGKTAFLHPKIASLTSKDTLPDIDYINKAAHVPDNFLPCKFPWSSVHINSDGNLFPCLAVSMGNVKENSLQNIINGKSFARFRDLIRKEDSVEGCNRCGWLRPKNIPA